MIKKFIRRLLGQPAATGDDAGPPPPVLGTRVELGVTEHGIDPTLLDANAVRVVKTLKDAGHETYIVGGAVRDLLVGLRPKDFDVATDATPEQVKALFRRAFIIGRRFRLVHVVFGRGRDHETIEVSTFRAYLDAGAAADAAPPAAADAPTRTPSRRDLGDAKHVVDASGRVLRDNVWGPQIEDAARRDFTVNAMYYDPLTQTVVDYHGGIGDVRARQLRLIGDAAARYREDPVRIVRAVRFAAKLGFTLEPATERPLRAMASLLANVPISRLFDEMVKLLQTGHALASVDKLREFGLVGSGPGVFPVLDAALAPSPPDALREKFVRLALEDTDRRVAEGRAVAPSFLLACLLWHDVLARWTALRADGGAPFPALQQAVDAVFDARIGDISGRGRLAADMREIWQLQPRFERRTPASVAALVEQARFRAGYDFLRLRADAGEVPSELAEWWEDFHLGSDDERDALLQAVRPAQGARRGGAAAARDRAPASAASTSGGGTSGPRDTDPAAEDATADALAAPARKRRRRRRRPSADRADVADPGDASAAPPAPDTAS